MADKARIQSILKETDGHLDPRIVTRIFEAGAAGRDDEIRDVITKAMEAYDALGRILQTILPRSDEGLAAPVAAASEVGIEIPPLKPGELTRYIFMAAQRLTEGTDKPFSNRQIRDEARQLAAPLDISDQQVRSAVKLLVNQDRLQRFGHNKYRAKAQPAADTPQPDRHAEAVH